MLHVYLFDTQGSRESIDVAKELVSMKLPDVRVLPVSAEPVRQLMLADGRVPLVPCVVSLDMQSGEWKDVFTNTFLQSHFVEPLRAATQRKAEPEPRPQQQPDRQLSINEIAQRMMDEREQDNPRNQQRFGRQ